MADDKISVAVQGENPGDLKIYTLVRDEKGAYRQQGETKDLNANADKDKIARWNETLKEKGRAPISPQQFNDFRAAESGPSMPSFSTGGAESDDPQDKAKDIDKQRADYYRQTQAYDQQLMAFRKKEAAVFSGAVASAEDPTDGRKTLDENEKAQVQRFENMIKNVKADTNPRDLEKSTERNVGMQIRAENDHLTRTQYRGFDDPQKNADYVAKDATIQAKMAENRTRNEAGRTPGGAEAYARLDGFNQLNKMQQEKDRELYKGTDAERAEHRSVVSKAWNAVQDKLNPDRAITSKMSGPNRNLEAAGNEFMAKYTNLKNGVLEISELPKNLQVTAVEDGRIKLTHTGGGKQPSVYIPVPKGTEVAFMDDHKQEIYDSSRRMILNEQASKVNSARKTEANHLAKLEARHGNIELSEAVQSKESERQAKIDSIRTAMKENPDMQKLASLDMRDGGNAHHANNPNQPTPSKGQPAIDAGRTA